MPQSVISSAVGSDGVTPISGSFTYTYYNEYGSNTQLFGPPLPGAPADAGYYTFIEDFTSQDPNYADGSFSWYLYIDPASPTVTINSGPFTYNGSASTGNHHGHGHRWRDSGRGQCDVCNRQRLHQRSQWCRNL